MTKKIKKPKQKKLTHVGIWVGLMVLALPLIVYGSYRVMFYQKIFPVTVAGVTLTQMTQGEAEMALRSRADEWLKAGAVRLISEDQSWDIPLTRIEPQWQIREAVETAYKTGRAGPLAVQLTAQWQMTQGLKEVPLAATYNQEGWRAEVASVAAEITNPPVPPRIEVTGEQVKVIEGKDGTRIDEVKLNQALEVSLSQLKVTPLPIPVITAAVVNDLDSFKQAEELAEKLLGQKISLVVEDDQVSETWTLTGEELITFIEVGQGISQEKVAAYVATLAQAVDRPPQDAKFNFNTTNQRVEEFLAPKNGLSLQVNESGERLKLAVEERAASPSADSVKLAVKQTPPSITLESVNDLGLKELLGRGTSKYAGSIATRVHNVALAASRINGTLVKPGEVFSFNQAVGDVSGATGYQQAYIIRNGRTELGDGGGVCQDSTTVFRAALNAGLPIVERKAHAYRVGYYEQDLKAGIDATVYAPSPDLKFLNDTPAHLLIQATADTPKRALTVEIYGTSDGREATITNHTVWAVTPPPPDVYTDDPTLAPGTVKQVDWKAGGAKAKFDYTVRRNGETIIEKTFTSSYKPWAAVFLRGPIQ